MEYLVESALLTHGLKSVSNETIKKEWQDPGKKITWIDHGEIRIGDIDEQALEKAAEYAATIVVKEGALGIGYDVNPKKLSEIINI